MDAAIPYPEPPLAGVEFVMRAFRTNDHGAALELERDPAAARWVPELPAADGAGVVAFYDECRRGGSLLHLVIADRRTDAYLGEAMLALGEHGVGEVGCCVVPAMRARGIATEVIRVLSDWAPATLGLGRVHVFVAPENTPAMRVAEGAGFQREGLLRSYWEIDGARVDVVVLSRLPEDERR